KEFLKAFQIAATRKKMVKSTEVNKSFLKHLSEPVLVIDKYQRIMDANFEAVAFFNKNYEFDLIGEHLNDFMYDTSFLKEEANKYTYQDNIIITVDTIIHNSSLLGYTLYFQKNKKQKLKNE